MRTEIEAFEAFPMLLECVQSNCSSRDPSSPSSSNSQALPELFHLCYYYKVPCQVKKIAHSTYPHKVCKQLNLPSTNFALPTYTSTDRTRQPFLGLDAKQYRL